MAQTLVLATLTFRRPEGLDRVVPALISQAVDVRACGVDAIVLVVDNDGTDSARVAVERLAEGGRSRDVAVRYEHEPTPGISAARNRALSAAGTADLLAFVDDDGEPTAGWAQSLLRTWRRHDAAAVVGRMVPSYDTRPPDWVEAGQFFVRPSHPTGTRMPGAATNNLLLDLRFVRATGLRFDEELSASGGEDSLFTRQLIGRGGKVVWCDEAVVIDHVPAERLTRAWVLRRRYRFGSTHVEVLLKLAGGRWGRSVARVRSSVKALLELGHGSTLVLVGACTTSLRRRALGEAEVARGLGRLAAVVGRRYHEYRRRDD